MSGIVRDVLYSLKHRHGVDGARPGNSEELARLDERLSGLAPAMGAARCAVSVRPGDCSIWDGKSANGKKLSVETCRALIESISDEGGNLVPIVLRPLPKGSDRPYELLVGSRRHFAVDWLNRNGRPEIRLTALVVDLSDEEAFRIADIENRDRTDIAELDRARSYRHALAQFYDGVQSRMAEALGVSNSQLSRLLALADLPDEIAGAFATTDDLRVRHSEILTPLLRRPEQRAALLEEAVRIGAVQERLCADGEKMIPAAAVLARLRDACAEEPASHTELTGGLPGVQELGTIEAFPGGIAVELVVPEFADLDEVLARLKQALVESRRDAVNEDRFTLR